MFEIVFLGLASWFIPIYFGTTSLILPVVVGAGIGIFARGSIGRIIGSIFALAATILPAGFYAATHNWTTVPAALFFGGVLFVGYLLGTVVRIVVTPLRWANLFFKKLK
ncbi:MAG: hypothetical protein GOV00_03395 [Candidatus Altiarchaeota archaeon]|nr:hypothetical protein [Candidatus Altiarchaeota archaeon]